MRRVMQSVKDGTLSLVEGPLPSISPTEVLVATRASLISSGTERALRELASSSLVSKAKARPDLVRQTLRRLRTDGVGPTVSAVRNRLSENMPLGYSAAGDVVAVGEAVAAIRPGERVATAGAGHAEMQVVAGTLLAPLPDGVDYESGAFATVAAVALNGLRLADISAGDRLVVVGLGLVGQLACRLASAMGAFVAGTDVDGWKLERAAAGGVRPFASDAQGWESLGSWTGGVGVDAVLVTASTKSSEPMNLAAASVRDQGIVVLVGDAGMDLQRRPLYDREVTVRVARSYGPGRYDPSYETAGVDYPIGHARWTAGRNIEAVVQLIGSGRLEVSDLITHRFPFDQAVDAYRFLEEGAPEALGIVLTYPITDPHVERARKPSSMLSAGPLSSGLIGAGHFAREVLLPAAISAGFGPWRSVASSGGSSAQSLGIASGFARVVDDPAEVIGDPDTSVVFIATRHDSHASYVAAALAAGRHVFCEKPLAISEEELETVEKAWKDSPATLMVGFNRRWSPLVADAKAFLGNGPVQIVYRVNAGALPPDHWLKDRRQGGRLLGEACHFIDVCNHLAGDDPSRVFASALGDAELLLDDNFSLMLAYPNGSQALIVYSAMAPSVGGKERVEILGRDRTVAIDDYHTILLRDTAKTKRHRIRPSDKGHAHELEVFAAAVRGEADAEAIARSAFVTSRAAFAAVQSLMTGRAAPVAPGP